MDPSKILYPFGAADDLTLDAAQASQSLTIENRKTLVSLAPSQATDIALAADAELPVGSEVDLLVDTGGTAYDVTFSGSHVGNTLSAAEQTVSGFATVTFVFDGTDFREKSRVVSV